MYKIIIIDYGLGNLGSIYNMLRHIGIESQITNNLAEIGNADKLILPGVGAFDHGMKNLYERNLKELLYHKVKEKFTPILGICLGMQLMGNSSEEGKREGLKWINAVTKRFVFEDSSIKIPHMGWNYVYKSKEHPLLKDMENDTRFYFVHSYCMHCADITDELLSCHYGIDFTCAVQHDNILGLQFHPEKSHRYGMQILKNFSKL
jgi:imidazole glycerol-phosphate synthase subunit HisH